MSSLGSASRDLAAQVAEEVKREHEDAIEDPEAFLDEKNELEVEARRSIFQKVTYKWHNSDRLILEQIEAGSNALFESEFARAIEVIDNFYNELRRPTGKIGPDGRPLWELDPDSGSPIEDWGQITGQDIDKALLDLQQIKFVLAPKVNKLLLQAVYAKYVYNDSHDDEWNKVIDGTQLDKTATANQKSKQEKYQAFFRYYLFRSADVFMKEIDNFIRVLEKMREWGIWSQRS